jgi:hypothetical protein
MSMSCSRRRVQEFGTNMVMETFRHGKDVVLMNAELDATIGPILQVYAERFALSSVAVTTDLELSRRARPRAGQTKNP